MYSRRWLLGAGIIAIALAGCDTASPPTDPISAEGRTAYQALMKLKSAAEVGTSYVQYNAQLIEADAAAELFFNHNPSGRDAELATPLNAALKAFTTANDVLRVQNAAGRPSVFSGNVYYDELVRAYPQATHFAREITATGSSEIRIPPVLEELFSEANAALAEATAVIQAGP